MVVQRQEGEGVCERGREMDVVFWCKAALQSPAPDENSIIITFNQPLKHEAHLLAAQTHTLIYDTLIKPKTATAFYINFWFSAVNVGGVSLCKKY